MPKTSKSADAAALRFIGLLLILGAGALALFQPIWRTPVVAVVVELSSIVDLSRHTLLGIFEYAVAAMALLLSVSWLRQALHPETRQMQLLTGLLYAFFLCLSLAALSIECDIARQLNVDACSTSILTAFAVGASVLFAVAAAIYKTGVQDLDNSTVSQTRFEDSSDFGDAAEAIASAFGSSRN